ncbi:autotransporter outer membrane beta-barrel domain-containing protein [Chachezhania sediminis]|uniref:autotransporter outer membrane beta-barrel domain-containing protein n=1 Tax=Chachezhania sediminis TaxID=2599291 RepID=UPI00131EB377|nr:autotransporter outer membrane beta-barrel domain-containing protein [Chachezhania sediminis]
MNPRPVGGLVALGLFGSVLAGWPAILPAQELACEGPNTGALSGQVLACQAGDFTYQSSSDLVTGSLGNGDDLPGYLVTGSGTGIDVTVNGALTFDGLPFGPGPAIYSVVGFETTADCFLNEPCTMLFQPGVSAGDLSVTLGSSTVPTGTDAITATAVTGSTVGPGALAAISRGGDGFGGAGAQVQIDGQDAAPIELVYGTDAGSVMLDLDASAAISVSGTGAAAVDGAPSLVGAKALSEGGGGSAFFWLEGIVVKEFGEVGAGGNAEPVAVATAAGSTIRVTASGADASAAGIEARAIGGAAGFYFDGESDATYTAGIGGAAGAVDVTHGGAIAVDAASGAGILAASIGGNGADSDLETPAYTGQPANGGTVNVTVQGAVDMSGGGMGVFASSQAGAWTPVGQTYLASGGTVNVSVGGTAVIATGSAGPAPGPLAIGVLGLSTGARIVSGLTSDPNLQGTGVAGTVTVGNAGSVRTNGASAFGVTALAVGGTTTVGSYSAGSNVVGNSATVTAGCGGSPSGCNDVTLNNTGSVMTLGTGSVGLAAVSSGGGGIAHNDTAIAFDSMGEMTAGTWVGSRPAVGVDGTDGGGITVNHSGSVTTGDGQGGGIGAIGIVAQSIGGGGGVVGGTEAVARLGDAAGGGGNGATVTVNLTGGANVLTRDAASVGILMQSIGGGGGSATNSYGAATTVGGAGGNGGGGGTITLNTSGATSVATLGNGSQGVLIQSIGGGGGNGGYAQSSSILVATAIGGAGGSGGAGGVASGYNNGQSEISTLGNRSSGMVVQSIGGGGGTGGAAVAQAAGLIRTIAVALGGAGGAGGDGTYATGINHGHITTGLSPDALQNIGLGSGGIFYGSLDDGTQLTADIRNGDIAEGMVSATLSNVTLTDGTVLTGVTVQGATVSGTVQTTGESFSGTMTNGGIFQAVGTDTTRASVTGLMLDGRFTAATGGPAVNGADSDGLVVQSIGGGGGIGGTAMAKSTVLPVVGLKLVSDVVFPSLGFSLANGGQGGDGGDGGGVTAGNYAAITTWGDYSRGILAQSVGGGGGNGGDGTAVSTAIQSASFSIQYAIGGGGDGGGNGDGGTVTAFNGTDDGSENGTIRTGGQFSAGIVAQSVGGGGGTGGSGSSSSATPIFQNETGRSLDLTYSVGGAGGSAGDGGSVFAYNYNGSRILTTGSTSYGILAQSIGGGGGDAGGASATGGGDTYTAVVAVGGAGGSGGAGQDVTVQNGGLIATTGGSGHGILAQSVGGGGGSGGTANASASALGVYEAYDHGIAIVKGWATGGTQSYNLDVSVGGAGGIGSDGGAVTVTSTGTIATDGGRAYGVLAQSIGGGGGQGAAATATSRSATPIYPVTDIDLRTYTVKLTTGGSNGALGTGGTVDLSNGGTVVTTGYGAHALAAQSIGGGGGTAFDGTMDSDLTIAVGQAMSNAPTQSTGGGGVTVTNSAVLATTGTGASAIVAQSIGGGGGIGSGGTDFFETIGGGKAGTATQVIKVGGDFGGDTDGATEAAGAAVTVSHTGQLATRGDWAHGILAQSVGGSGGIGSAYTTSSVMTDLTVSVGSFGTQFGWGDGGTVKVDLADGAGSRIVTGSETVVNGITTRTGFAAFGILAQSIGGAGGLAMAQTDGGAAKGSAVALGGSGSGAGGLVELTGQASVATHGDAAHAVVLQSIGGGGGVAGQGSSANTGGAGTVDLSIAGVYPDGAGGNVTVSNAVLTVTTAGDNAYGLLAQSIGGGGGLIFAQDAAMAADVSLNVNSYEQPNMSPGGAVSITLDAGSGIVTGGDGAHAIVAQSIGGGGGILGFGAPGTLSPGMGQSSVITSRGGSVDIDVDASILTTGAGAHGILAQSVGGSGGLIAYGGAVHAGSAGAPGTDTGGQITITQAGSLATTGTGSTAIFAQTSAGLDVTIGGTVTGNSHGLWADTDGASTLTIGAGASLSAVSGNVILQSGTAALDVTNMGTLSGSAVALNDGTLTNAGLLDAGSGLSLNGNFVQQPGGTLSFALIAPIGGATAPVSVSGTAVLDGTLQPVVGDWLLPKAVPVLSAPGIGLSGTFATVTSDSPLFAWTQILSDDPVSILATADLTAPTGSDANAVALSQNLQANWTAANPDYAGIFAALYNGVPKGENYQSALASISPQTLDTLTTAFSDTGGEVLGTALSCPEFRGQSLQLAEGRCVWIQGGDFSTRYDRLATKIGRTVTGLGGQTQIADGWYLGGAFRADFVSANGRYASGSGTNYFATVALKRVSGPWLLAGSLAAGVGEHDLERREPLGGPATLRSRQRPVFMGVRLRAAYDIAVGRHYIRPMADLDLYAVRTPAYAEEGASPFAMSVKKNTDTNVALSPAVEFGLRRDLKRDGVLRGFVNLGATGTVTGGRQIDASFVSGGDIRTEIYSPDLVGRVTAGLQVYQTKGWDIRAEYGLTTGNDFRSHGGILRLSYRF